MRKKPIVLICEKSSKRLIFFDKVVDKKIYDLISMEWNNIDLDIIKMADFVKIEPPTIKEFKVGYLNKFIKEYYENLEMLEELSDVRYLNRPRAIIECLDKVNTKKLLESQNIPTTQMLGHSIKNYEKLQGLLEINKCNEVFIKPRFGSGACGVIAYRRNLKTGKEIIYTTSILDSSFNLVNSKQINKISKPNIIKNIIDAICKSDVIVEQWVKKDKIKDITYDLRVVCQFGEIDYIIGRGSNGVITNLHLNNKHINLEELHFTSEEINKLKKICRETLECFEGLNTAGIDILVTRNRDFRVIGVNSQGDLIYSDIYNDNVIYKNQMKYFSKI